MSFSFKHLVTAAALSGFAASAADATTVVQYSQANPSQQTIQLQNVGNTYTISNTTPGGQLPLVFVSLFDPLTNSTGFGQARLTFTASGNSAANVMGNNVSQLLNTGSLSLISTTSITIGSLTMAAGSNILSLSFTNGELLGVLAGNNPTVSVSLPASGFTSFTSDFLASPPLFLSDFSITMSGANPSLAISGDRLGNFAASSVGTFNVVPEPGTWAMLIAGFGMVGAARRRRRSVVAA
jgi:hypothetical protein